MVYHVTAPKQRRAPLPFPFFAALCHRHPGQLTFTSLIARRRGDRPRPSSPSSFAIELNQGGGRSVRIFLTRKLGTSARSLSFNVRIHDRWRLWFKRSLIAIWTHVDRVIDPLSLFPPLPGCAKSPPVRARGSTQPAQIVKRGWGVSRGASRVKYERVKNEKLVHVRNYNFNSGDSSCGRSMVGLCLEKKQSFLVFTLQVTTLIQEFAPQLRQREINATVTIAARASKEIGSSRLGATN